MDSEIPEHLMLVLAAREEEIRKENARLIAERENIEREKASLAQREEILHLRELVFDQIRKLHEKDEEIKALHSIAKEANEREEVMKAQFGLLMDELKARAEKKMELGKNDPNSLNENKPVENDDDMKMSSIRLKQQVGLPKTVSPTLPTRGTIAMKMSGPPAIATLHCPPRTPVLRESQRTPTSTPATPSVSAPATSSTPTMTSTRAVTSTPDMTSSLATNSAPAMTSTPDMTSTPAITLTPISHSKSTVEHLSVIEYWRELAEQLYANKTNKYSGNCVIVGEFLDNRKKTFAPLLSRCPNIKYFLANVLVSRFGFSQKSVDWTKKAFEWSIEDCENAGYSLGKFLRESDNGKAAMTLLIANYPQLTEIFDEVSGFSEFFVVLLNNMVRDSIHGTAYRVGIGAALSSVDAATDIYVVSQYIREGLSMQAITLVVMISANVFVQLGCNAMQYAQKSWSVKVRELLFTLCFLRPIVDAYRLTTNHDDDTTVDTMTEFCMNKGIELASESIPGCVLQIYVLLTREDQVDVGNFASILISALTTGYTSALIAFNMDVDVSRRKLQPLMYGYIPNGKGRSRCFILMLLLSTLHNLSRSIGCAVLIAADREIAAFSIIAEILFFLLYKTARKDFLYWFKVDGFIGVIFSLLVRTLVKIIVDFCGCFHMRHPFELGGRAFTISLIWAQIWPFFALQWYESDNAERVLEFLVASFCSWCILSSIFFCCCIDVSYLGTFFGNMTGPQYAVHLYRTSENDYSKFDALFDNRLSYTTPVHEEGKQWVEANIDGWMALGPDWFRIDEIHEDFLPPRVKSQGLRRRRKSSVSERLSSRRSSDRSLRYILSSSKVLPVDFDAVERDEGKLATMKLRNLWRNLAESLYASRTNNHELNYIFVDRFMSENSDNFDPIIERCPKFGIILAFLLQDRLGLNVASIDWTLRLADWSTKECKIAGKALWTFVRKRKTGDAAVDAWRRHYAPLEALFDIPGFQIFMNCLANNMIRDSMYGTILRVALGAAMSTIDAATDIYVIATYTRENLWGQAASLFFMIVMNLAIQVSLILGSYVNKGWGVKIREILITIFFLRPAVDAYRVSINHIDKKKALNPLTELIMNKACELGCESIPGCILQIYVVLRHPEQVDKFSMLSILVSAMTTGLASAMISFDLDCDVTRRGNQPNFYGYVPDNNKQRSRCFLLMVAISTFQTLSKSIGCALLFARDKNIALLIIGGELLLYHFHKLVRCEYSYWVPYKSKTMTVAMAFCEKCISKIICDFSGCVHLRHPFELGGTAYFVSVVWAQIFPFVALLLFGEEFSEKGTILIFLVCTCTCWFLASTYFFCIIDPKYLSTFFVSPTAPNYAIQCFKNGVSDRQKFDAVFENTIEFTRVIHDDVRAWVEERIDVWLSTKPNWFNLEKIPSELLSERMREYCNS